MQERHLALPRHDHRQPHVGARNAVIAHDRPAPEALTALAPKCTQIAGHAENSAITDLLVLIAACNHGYRSARMPERAGHMGKVGSIDPAIFLLPILRVPQYSAAHAAAGSRE